MVLVIVRHFMEFRILSFQLHVYQVLAQDQEGMNLLLSGRELQISEVKSWGEHVQMFDSV